MEAFLEPRERPVEMSKLLDARFVDKKNREWIVRFDGNSMRDIKAELGINLCDAIVDTKAFTESLDVDKMMAMVWVACREQADQINVDAKEFLSGLFGETLSDLSRACWSAILNFSQPSESLGTAKKILDQSYQAMEKRRATRLKEIDALTPEEVELLMEPDDEPKSIREIIAEKRAKKLTATEPIANSSNLPGMSESTPAG